MDKLISEHAAIDIVEFECGELSGLAKTIVKAIEQLPPTQPEIIRCKDCKWKNRHNCTRAVEVPIDDDKYCAWAERRTDETD